MFKLWCERGISKTIIQVFSFLSFILFQVLRSERLVFDPEDDIYYLWMVIFMNDLFHDELVLFCST